MRIIVTFVLAVLLVGCAVPREISGSYVLLDAGSPPAKTLPKDVKIYLEHPEQKYRVVALVEASATINKYSSFADVESGLLSELAY